MNCPVSALILRLPTHAGRYLVRLGVGLCALLLCLNAAGLPLQAQAPASPSDTLSTPGYLLAAADAAVQEKNYPQAAAYYGQAVRLAPEHAALCYNLGTCYLHAGQRGLAVVWLMRARALSPHSRAVLQNLELARTSRGSAGALTSINNPWQGFYSLLRPNGWALAALLTFTASLAGLYFFLTARHKRGRKGGFYLLCAALSLSVLAFVAMQSNLSALKPQDMAVITVPRTALKSEPSPSASDLGYLTDGTEVHLLGAKPQGGYLLAEAAGQGKGWIATAHLLRPFPYPAKP